MSEVNETKIYQEEQQQETTNVIILKLEEIKEPTPVDLKVTVETVDLKQTVETVGTVGTVGTVETEFKIEIKPENVLEESKPTEENLTKLEGKQIN